MAISSIKGSVARVFFNGKGAQVDEEFTVAGKPLKKSWTAWFEEPHGLAVGDVVEVSGLHSDELNEWEKDGELRRSVKRSINKARIKGSSSATASQVADEAWATPSYTDETPF